MIKNTVVISSLLLLSSCYPVDDTDEYSESVSVHEFFWGSKGNSDPYPFNVEYGEIYCSMDRVFFYPNETAYDEASIGWALNDEARIVLEIDELTPTVKNPVKPNADLNEAIKTGLAICERNNDQKIERIEAS